MEFADLNTLLTVAREHSFSRAALLLNRTQPAVSLAVRRLEQRMGTSLFTRETKRPELTEAGRLLVTYAQKISTVQQDARRALARLRELRCGDVTVSIDETLVGALLPFVGAFRADHPGVRVVLTPVPAGAALETLVSGSVNLGVTDRLPPADQFETATIGRDRWVLVLATRHPLARRSSVSLTDLREETVIVMSGASVERRHAPSADALAHPTAKAGLTMPSLDAVKRAVASGLGVAFLPSSATAQEVTDGRLSTVPVREDPGRRSIHLARARGRANSLAADEFFRLVEARAASLRGATGARSRAVPASRDRRATRPGRPQAADSRWSLTARRAGAA